MRVYLASNLDSKPRVAKMRERIRALGHTVVSTWLDEDSDQNFASLTDKARQRYAYRDLDEIMEADLFILDTIDESPTGGREVECGVALGKGIPVWIVGPERNIFHSVSFLRYDSWWTLLMDLPDLTRRPHASV